MITLSIVRIAPLPEKRREVVNILLSIKGPTQAVPGCLACHVCEEQGEDQTIICVAQWQSQEELFRHIRSHLFTRILEAMELSGSEPEISFFRVSGIRGMDLVEAVRNVNPAAAK